MQHLLHFFRRPRPRHTITISAFQDYTRLSELNALYTAFRKDYLPVPDAQALWDIAEEGQLFVAELTNGENKGSYVGAAGLFPVGVARDGLNGPPIEVVELAGMVVDGRALGGFGIQELMISIRTLARARVQQHGICVIASVADANERSLKNLKKMGLVECHTPPWLQAVGRAWCPEHIPITNVVVQPQALSVHAKLLCGIRRSQSLSRVNRTTGRMERVRVHLRLSWVHDEKKFLRHLARGLSVDWNTAIPAVRLVGRPGDWVPFEG